MAQSLIWRDGVAQVQPHRNVGIYSSAHLKRILRHRRLSERKKGGIFIFDFRRASTQSHDWY
jgi:hypothetical protein